MLLQPSRQMALWSLGELWLRGGISGVSSKLSADVVKIFSNKSAFCALKSDGSLVSWGYNDDGGNNSAVASRVSSGVIEIYSTASAFAALKADGSVVTWGDSSCGGDSSSITAKLGSNVTQIFSTNNAFAALKTDGSVYTWGDSALGGNSSSVASQLGSDVSQIFSNASAFAALKSDGSVITWGYESYGGNSSAVANKLTSGITKIFSTGSAFAALKDDGSVVTWGYEAYGGDSSSVSAQLSGGVSQLFSNYFAFTAALKKDGSMVSWGDPAHGGNNDQGSGQLSTAIVGAADPYTDEYYVPLEPNLANGSFASAAKIGMRRLFDPLTGFHFYTANNAKFFDNIPTGTLLTEGFAFDVNLEVSNNFTLPVHRLQDMAGRELLTVNMDEINFLCSIDYLDLGVAFYSAEIGNVATNPIQRFFNPNNGDHLYSCVQAEMAGLPGKGWIDEGIAFNL